MAALQFKMEKFCALSPFMFVLRMQPVPAMPSTEAFSMATFPGGLLKTAFEQEISAVPWPPHVPEVRQRFFHAGSCWS
jgi:hypothetical protein